MSYLWLLLLTKCHDQNKLRRSGQDEAQEEERESEDRILLQIQDFFHTYLAFHIPQSESMVSIRILAIGQLP